MSDARQNIVLVSIDSLRADHCGFLGDDRGLTPTMDTLAAEGVNFETAIAPGPQTFSSMPAVFTGHHRPPGGLESYPGETHWERRLAAIQDHVNNHVTLPERLQKRGYSTAGFSPNPWTSTASGFDRGFDHFNDGEGDSAKGFLRGWAGRVPGIDESSKLVELTLDMLTGSSFFTRWEDYYDQIEAAREQLSEPYFLWVFLLDTHYPFLPARAHRQEQSLYGMLSSSLQTEAAMRGNADTMSAGVRESMERSYRDTVRSVDSFVDRLRTDLSGDDPAFIIHSDHGESFGDHGNYGHHHRQLYEENIHVPYIIHNAGRRRDVVDPSSLASIPEMALSLTREGDLDPESAAGPAAISTSECGRNRAIRYRQFKYVESDGDSALFDLLNDPGETVDIAAEYPERSAESRAFLDRFERHRDESERVSRAARSVAIESLR